MIFLQLFDGRKSGAFADEALFNRRSGGTGLVWLVFGGIVFARHNLL